MFSCQTKVKLHHTDAAGVIFFANQFTMIHDAYEMILDDIGSSFSEMLNDKDFFLPIVHAESDYLAPVTVGDILTITIKVGNIGTTSFSFEYTLVNQNKLLVGKAQTVHVTIDKKTKTKIKLPDEMRQALEKYIEN